MPLYEWRCEVCGVFEALAPVSDAMSPRICSCGVEAKRVYSTFALKTYLLDRADWSMIAPLDEEGKPMTMKEAAKAGAGQSYSPDEAAREAAHQSVQEERLKENRMEQAKREAWREVSAKNRIVV